MQVAPYTALAAGYDVVMEHVDYDDWAAYAHRLLQRHGDGARTVLELGCGTGELALALQPLGPYDYAATDGSPEMIRVAQAKAELQAASVQFEVADFTDFRVEPAVDALVLLYDGLNYLLEEDAVRALFGCAWRALRPGGVFLCDVSTPVNSLHNNQDFQDEGRADGFAYVRRSRYDADARLHTTTFELTVEDAHFHEEHVQRAYRLDEIRPLFEAAGFDEAACYDGFTLRPASTTTERAHWVLRKMPGPG